MHLPPCYTRMTRSHDFDGSRVFDGIDLYGEEKTAIIPRIYCDLNYF